MNIINKIKRITVLALTAILLTTGIAFSGAQVEAQAATNEVSMYYADSMIGGYRGMSQQIIYIKVKNLGSNKSVALHSTNSINPTVWTDDSASYVKTLSDGSEIWKVVMAFPGTLTYAIKYTVNGKTYWDNNSGKNYTNNMILGVSPVVNNRLSYYACLDSTKYPIEVTIKNLAYTKAVTVKYTEDNWATTKSKALSYSTSYVATNSEIWKTTLNLDASKINNFKYYIVYSVNGVTYYDNNLGDNYTNAYRLPVLY